LIIATANLFAQVIPSLVPPLLYQVVKNAVLGPPSVFHLGRAVELRLVVASALYEWEVMTPRYVVDPALMRLGR